MLTTVYQRLFGIFGPQHWWPAESRFEVIVGAILTQNTNWKNVERAIENLRAANVLDVESIAELPQSELEEYIRPAGCFRVKAQRLKNIVQFLVLHYDGAVEAMCGEDLSELRRRLLRVKGVGPETADSILLYAAGLPSFVIDTYTARIVKRHGWIDPDADYDALKGFFEASIPPEIQIYNEFHALIVLIGKDYCKPTPKCEDCPLRDLLPETGTIELASVQG